MNFLSPLYGMTTRIPFEMVPIVQSRPLKQVFPVLLLKNQLVILTKAKDIKCKIEFSDAKQQFQQTSYERREPDENEDDGKEEVYQSDQKSDSQFIYIFKVNSTLLHQYFQVIDDQRVMTQILFENEKCNF